MAEKSFTGNVDTNKEWETLASVSSLSFTNGEMYTIYVGGLAEIKLGEAIFPVNNERFYWTPSSGGSTLYIRNIMKPMTLVIYGAN